MTGRDDITEHPSDTAAHPEVPDRPERADERPADEQMVDLRLRVRRAPNFARFIIVGFVLGVLLGGVIDLIGPSGTSAMQQGGVDYGAVSGLAFLAAVCGLLGALLAAIVAVLLDRRS